MTAPPFCICVPARDEEQRLPILLAALAAQDVEGPVALILCINDSDDRSADIARGWPDDRLTIVVDDCRLPPDAAHVGTARGLAMDAGLRRVGDGGVLLTTDADCRPPPTWVSANLAAIARGADIVGGRIALDEDEAIAPALRAARARIDRYWAQVREIEDLIDPQPHDPAPRHGDHTGASLAIRAALYRAAGGVPALPSGEDRALVAAAAACGGRLAHPVDVWTRTSARTIGRAPGGMADAMAMLDATVIRGEDPRVPDLAHWRRRATWRAALRMRSDGAAEIVRQEAMLPPMPCDMPLSAVA